MLGEVQDEAGLSGGVAADGEVANCVLDVAADGALGIEDGEAAGRAVRTDGDHNAVRELAGRNGPVSEGVLGKFVVLRTAGAERQSRKA